MQEIYEEDKSYWPYGLSVKGHDDLYLVREKQASTPVGFVGFQKIPDNTGKTIGYYTVGIKKAHRNNGYAKEAINTMLEEKKAEVDELRAMICEHNTASRNLASAIGINTDIHKDDLWSKLASYKVTNAVGNARKALEGIDDGFNSGIEAAKSNEEAQAKAREAEAKEREQKVKEQERIEKEEEKRKLDQEKRELERQKLEKEKLQEHKNQLQEERDEHERIKQLGLTAVGMNMKALQRKQDTEQAQQEAEAEAKEQEGQSEPQSLEEFAVQERPNPFAKNEEGTMNGVANAQEAQAAAPNIQGFYKNSAMKNLAKFLGAGTGMAGLTDAVMYKDDSVIPGIGDDPLGNLDKHRGVELALSAVTGGALPFMKGLGAKTLLGSLPIAKILAGSANKTLQGSDYLLPTVLGLLGAGGLGLGAANLFKDKEEEKRDVALQIPASKLSDKFYNRLSREMLFYTPEQKEQRIAELKGSMGKAASQPGMFNSIMTPIADTVGPMVQRKLDPMIQQGFGLGKTLGGMGIPIINWFISNPGTKKSLNRFNYWLQNKRFDTPSYMLSTPQGTASEFRNLAYATGNTDGLAEQATFKSRMLNAENILRNAGSYNRNSFVSPKAVGPSKPINLFQSV
jgi:hypothetical protein